MTWLGATRDAPKRSQAAEPVNESAEGSIERVAFASALLERAVTGSITDDAWRKEVARALGALHGMPARDGVDEWSRLRGEVDQAVLWLVRDVRREAPVALLANATTRLLDDLTATRPCGRVRRHRQLGRPASVEARSMDFRRTARLLGASCVDCAFVDDEPRHVVAARAVGMAAIQHRNAAMTRRRLARMGVLGSIAQLPAG